MKCIVRHQSIGKPVSVGRAGGRSVGRSSRLPVCHMLRHVLTKIIVINVCQYVICQC
jgi:hypothetical protein